MDFDSLDSNIECHSHRFPLSKTINKYFRNFRSRRDATQEAPQAANFDDAVPMDAAGEETENTPNE